MALEFTGERYIPELKSPKISYEHWHRYVFTKQFVPNKTILDVACGEGYGAAYLAQFANHVTGVDISEEAIFHAQKNYFLNNLSFISTNANKLSFNNNIFDVITSFETIEHLSKEDQELFLSECKRILKDEGLLIISTPNKKIYSDKNNYQNPFHLYEFYEDGFLSFLKNKFNNVFIFQQQIFSGSLIMSHHNSTINQEGIQLMENGFTPTSIKELSSSEYLIAICSDVSFSLPPNNILIDPGNSLYSETNI